MERRDLLDSNGKVFACCFERFHELAALTARVVKIAQSFTNNFVAPFIILSRNLRERALKAGAS